MSAQKITAIIIAKNNQDIIKDCLESVKWVGEIVLVDTGSTDKTVEIATKYTKKIVSVTKGGYSNWRNKGLKTATGDWVLYVDTDEVITSDLRKEINKVISGNNTDVAYAIPRRNMILKKEMKHGGWWPDYVIRLFKKDCLKTWEGSLHEEPRYKGNLGHLKSPMIHNKHDNLTDMITKTNNWSEIEAKLLYDSGHPKMSVWRFIRIMITELCFRLFRKGGLLDGVEGIIYAFYQMWSKFVTYTKLWEMQTQK